MNPHLFVYGSLMSSAGHAMGARLAQEARLIGAASMQGRLHRISWYPGLVEADDASARVHGEVYALADPAHALAWLDEYEGTASGIPGQQEYIRVERTARLASGADITAWVYLYRGDVRTLTAIASGRWVPSH